MATLLEPGHALNTSGEEEDPQPPVDEGSDGHSTLSSTSVADGPTCAKPHHETTLDALGLIREGLYHLKQETLDLKELLNGSVVKVTHDNKHNHPPPSGDCGRPTKETKEQSTQSTELVWEENS